MDVLVEWFTRNREQFHPGVMKTKMTQTNLRFASDLPHTSLCSLRKEYSGYCKAANAQATNDVDRNTQRDLTLRLVVDEECPVAVCLYLYNGLRSAGEPHVCDDANVHEIDQQAVLLEALSIVLTDDWRCAPDEQQ